MQEADVLLPKGWSDRSINTFVMPSGSNGGAISIVVTRDYDSLAAELIAFVDQQLVLAAQKLPGYQYLSRAAASLDGERAVQADYSWRSPDGKTIRQRQIVAKLATSFLIVTLTALEADFAVANDYWLPFLQSFHLRRD